MAKAQPTNRRIPEIKVSLVFVPPGGGEAEYGLDFEMLSVPRLGDYVSVQRDDRAGRTIIQLAVDDWVFDRLLEFDGGGEDLEDSGAQAA
jgi:hypothetical protein